MAAAASSTAVGPLPLAAASGDAVTAADLDGELFAAKIPSEFRDVAKHVIDDIPTFVRTAARAGPEKLAETTQRLEETLACISAALDDQVIGCHDDLLQNVGNVDKLSVELLSVKQAVTAISGTLSRMCSDTVAPLGEIRQRLFLLNRLLDAQGIVRDARIFASGVRLLELQSGDSSRQDLPRIADKLRELRTILETNSAVQRLTFLSDNILLVERLTASVKRQAAQHFATGLSEKNKSSLVVACRVFSAFDSVATNVDAAFSEALNEVTTCFDAKAIISQSVSSSMMVNVGTISASAADIFWQRLQNFSRALATNVTRLNALDEALATVAFTSGGGSGNNFSTRVDDRSSAGGTTHRLLWDNGVHHFCHEMRALSRATDSNGKETGPALLAALAGDFPKYLTHLQDTTRHVISAVPHFILTSDDSSGIDKPANDRRAKAALGRGAALLEDGLAELRACFFTQSWDKLAQPLLFMFPTVFASGAPAYVSPDANRTVGSSWRPLVAPQSSASSGDGRPAPTAPQAAPTGQATMAAVPTSSDVKSFVVILSNELARSSGATFFEVLSRIRLSLSYFESAVRQVVDRTCLSLSLPLDDDMSSNLAPTAGGRSGGSESTTAVTAASLSAYRRNACLFEAVATLASAVESQILHSAEIADYLGPAVKDLATLKDELIAGWILSLEDAVCRQLLPRMHDEYIAISSDGMENGGEDEQNDEGDQRWRGEDLATESDYVRHIKSTLSFASNQYFCVLSASSIQPYLHKAIARMIEATVANVLFVKPLAQAVKSRLIVDLSSIEAAFASFCPFLSSALLPIHFGCYHSLRRLLLWEVSQLFDANEAAKLHFFPSHATLLHVLCRLPQNVPSLSHYLGLSVADCAERIAPALIVGDGTALRKSERRRVPAIIKPSEIRKAARTLLEGPEVQQLLTAAAAASLGSGSEAGIAKGWISIARTLAGSPALKQPHLPFVPQEAARTAADHLGCSQSATSENAPHPSIDHVLKGSREKQVDVVSPTHPDRDDDQRTKKAAEAPEQQEREEESSDGGRGGGGEVKSTTKEIEARTAAEAFMDELLGVGGVGGAAGGGSK